MSWVYFIVGITCLVALQLLRSVLSMQFPAFKAAPIRRPDPHSFGGMDLIDAKTAALSKLGFDGPAWVGSDSTSTDGSLVSAHAVYRNKEDHVVAWLGPTIELSQPGQLLSYYTTLLQDGRYAVTQVSDPYFAAVDDPRTPAQTIAASDAATELELHKSFVASLGVSPARATPREDVLQFAGEHMTGIRSRLLERRRIAESGGIARPTLAFSAAVLRALLTRPKPAAPDTNPIPTPRLTFLAGVVEQIRNRAPSQPMQWLLLLLSSVLFVVIGWPLLGLEFTLVILGVIAFHEAGHWAAMRMFGYRNPHITLLPLLGGVTIGHETDPSAAKRAWVALAGPLPGIVLAWILVYLVGSSPTDFAVLDGWVLSTIIALLFVNYLNVLPIPPLDGSHVVQAVLPPRWLTVQTLFIIAGVAVGFYIAYLVDFWPIALIAALQLLGLKSLWTTTRLVRRFSKSPPPAGLDDAARTAWLLTRLEEEVGPPGTAAKRIALANNILTQLDTQPMGGVQRTAVSGLYLALLVVPVSVLALTAIAPFSGMPRPEAEAMSAAYQEEYDDLAAAAARLDHRELIELLSDEDSPRAAAGEDAMAAAEARLGRALPAHLRDFYQVTNGMQVGLGIGPVESIRAADPETFESGDLMYGVYEDGIYFYSETFGDIVISVERTEGWWYIGTAEQEWPSYIYVDPQARPGEPAVFSFNDDDMVAYESMRDLLESAWVGHRSADFYAAQVQRLTAEVAESMKGLDVLELIDEFPKPSLLERLITRNLVAHGPATPDALATAEALVGYPLPEDYRRLLEVHNGFLPMAILSVEDIRPARETNEYSLARALEISSELYPGITEQEIAGCWAIAGHFSGAAAGESASDLLATLLWCPQMAEEQRYLSLVSDRFHSSFTAVARDQAALLNAFQR